MKGCLVFFLVSLLFSGARAAAFGSFMYSSTQRIALFYTELKLKKSVTVCLISVIFFAGTGRLRPSSRKASRSEKRAILLIFTMLIRLIFRKTGLSFVSNSFSGILVRMVELSR